MTSGPSELDSWPVFVRPPLVVLNDGETWTIAILFNAIADEKKLTDALKPNRLG